MSIPWKVKYLSWIIKARMMASCTPSNAWIEKDEKAVPKDDSLPMWEEDATKANKAEWDNLTKMGWKWQLYFVHLNWNSHTS